MTKRLKISCEIDDENQNQFGWVDVTHTPTGVIWVTRGSDVWRKEARPPTTLPPGLEEPPPTTEVAPTELPPGAEEPPPTEAPPIAATTSSTPDKPTAPTFPVVWKKWNFRQRRWE